jgi:hypothetical protein
MMADMVRKQIYLKSRQIRAIQKRADVLGVSESELIRRAIDSELRGSTPGFYPDPEAKEELKRFLLTYQPAKLEGPPYRFNREEIYDERLDRYHGNPD